MNATDRMRIISKLNEPKTWPRWPVLPMKNKDGRAGYCVTADYPLVLLVGFPSMKGILLQLAVEDGLPVPGQPKVMQADDHSRAVYEKHVEARFTDIDEMIDAGWEVD